MNLPYGLLRFMQDHPKDGPWNPFSTRIIVPVDSGVQVIAERRRLLLSYHVPTHLSASSKSAASHDGSSVRNEEELATVKLPRLAVCDSLPKAEGPGQFYDDFGQGFAGNHPSHAFERPVPSFKASGVSASGSKRKATSSLPDVGTPYGSVDAAKAPPSENRYWACPFPKHDPERYVDVYNACTNRPGWIDLKRVVEHLHKVHSTKFCCVICRKRCYDQKSLDKHLSEHRCKAVAESSSDPEWMTPEQEGVFNRRFDVGTTNEEKYRAYYILLFPNDPKGPSVNPYYDYTTLTHRLPPSIPDDTPQNKGASPAFEFEINPHIVRYDAEGFSTAFQPVKSILPGVYPRPVDPPGSLHDPAQKSGQQKEKVGENGASSSRSTPHDSGYDSVNDETRSTVEPFTLMAPPPPPPPPAGTILGLRSPDVPDGFDSASFDPNMWNYDEGTMEYSFQWQ